MRCSTAMIVARMSPARVKTRCPNNRLACLLPGMYLPSRLPGKCPQDSYSSDGLPPCRACAPGLVASGGSTYCTVTGTSGVALRRYGTTRTRVGIFGGFRLGPTNLSGAPVDACSARIEEASFGRKCFLHDLFKAP